MSYPFTLDDYLRTYDQIIYQWLENLKINYGQLGGVPRTSFGILRCFATPRRAFATMEDLLQRKKWLSSETPGDGSGANVKSTKSYQRIPLPFASIMRTGATPDPTRFIPGMFNVYSEDGQTVKKYKFPFPINIPVQIDFWYKQQYTGNHIYEWFLSQMGITGQSIDEILFNVTPVDKDGNRPYGTKIAHLKMTALDDNSDLEPGDQQRNLRLTASFIFETWLFKPPMSTDGRFGTLDGPVDVVNQPDLKPPVDAEFDTVFSVSTSIKRLDKKMPYCTSEAFDELDFYSFSLMETSDLQLYNESGLAKISLYEKTAKFYPVSAEDYLFTANMYVLPETYKVGGSYLCQGVTFIQVLDEDGVEIDSTTLIPVIEEAMLDWDVVIPEHIGKCSLRIFSDNRLTLNNLSFRRITDTYRSSSSASSQSSASSSVSSNSSESSYSSYSSCSSYSSLSSFSSRSSH